MRALKLVAIYLAALAGAIIGIFAVLTLGLIAHELVILPLALFVGALLSSVGAAWAAGQLSSDGTRTRLLPVVIYAEVGALMAALIIIGLYLADAARPANLLPPPGLIGLAVSLALALDVSLAARRFRAAPSEAGQQRRLSLALLALALVSVPLVLVVASLFGLTGA
ncbi:MAG TPA: hypothetical protein VFX76_09100 [Roseiflexaceae bacterium]|nr:hypothetical protein [Roseiflexaceae bacterium]